MTLFDLITSLHGVYTCEAIGTFMTEALQSSWETEEELVSALKRVVELEEEEA